MDPRREFVSYTHPSQFQDRQHRKQVKSYVSKRAYWIERHVQFDIRRPLRSKPQFDGREAVDHRHVFPSSGVQRGQQTDWDKDKSTGSTWHDDDDAVAANTWRKAKIKVQAEDKGQASRICDYCRRDKPPLLPVVTLNGLPDVLRQSQGFLAANEFCESRRNEMSRADVYYWGVCLMNYC
jgi:hypothetical protein